MAAAPPPSSPSRRSSSSVGSADSLELMVPGRVCLFGEHSDWAGSFTRFNSEITPGMTIVVGTNQGIHARVRVCAERKMVLTCTRNDGSKVGPYEIPMEQEALLAVAKEGGFWSYAAGVGYKIMTDYRVGGIVIDNYLTDLPIRKGLSSSAAFCVLVARAFNRLYDIKMTTRGEMEYAYQGELVTPSRCGRMDQGCAFGCRPVVMHYDGEFMDVEAITLSSDATALHYVVVDLAGDKSTTEILAGLQAGYPFPQTAEARDVHELLGPLNRAIVSDAAAALRVGDAEKLGALMRQSQEAWDRLGTPACPSQLTAPLLHRVLTHAPLQPHIYGGKGVGSQGDGTCQLLVRGGEAGVAAVQKIIEEDFGMSSLSLKLEPNKGVRTGVIPAAGFCASLYPASKAVKPELFPIVDRDGVTKPAILVNVEELLRAGLERIIIIVQPEDLPLFERLFLEADTPQNFHKLGGASQDYARRITAIGEQVTFVTQQLQEGFGHALHTAAAAVGNEPFVLLIGKHVYKSSTETCVTRQLLDAYHATGTSVMGLKRSRKEQVSSFGCAAGAVAAETGYVGITELVEKPTQQYAADKLVMHEGDVENGEFLTAFGAYVLSPKVFGLLAENVKHNLRSAAGNFCLTTVLDRLRLEEGLVGCEVKGQRFNISTVSSYIETIADFNK